MLECIATSAIKQGGMCNQARRHVHNVQVWRRQGCVAGRGDEKLGFTMIANDLQLRLVLVVLMFVCSIPFILSSPSLAYIVGAATSLRRPWYALACGNSSWNYLGYEDFGHASPIGLDWFSMHGRTWFRRILARLGLILDAYQWSIIFGFEVAME